MRRLAVIPARGGSKRLPRKNVIDFRGRPIVAYTIEAALAAARFDTVAVSTEDDEIARVAGDWGAEVRRRDPGLAGDAATINQVCLALLDAEEAAGRRYDVMAILYATAPLRTAEDIAAVVDLVEPGVCDFAMAVTRCAEQAHQALKAEGDNRFAPMWPELAGRRESEVGPFYRGNGSTYAVGVDAYRRLKTVYGPGLKGHVMPRARSVDIDDADDLALARFHAERAGP